MKLNFGGIVPISTIDWYGRASLVIFFRGCPFRCIYCQNPSIINGIDLVDIETIKNKILNTSSFISAVVFSGGEPTMQYGALKSLAQYAKDLNLDVGIQTNGYYPYAIKELISLSLVDKILISIKAPLVPNVYAKVVGVQISNGERIVRHVAKTLDILKSSTVCFEVTTTVLKSFFENIEQCINYITSIAEIL
ncbi:MAG: anaerobic ribonucleoside-triphosphate reductase activating protein, partial [Methanosarcinales archaeon]